MAVNDPTAGVPTPTGVLQGAATFSWDGSTWQPSARASAGVGTPTGVLRGVAPFSWSGSAWTPAGGGPDAATPGGVLDGVAVYTWSGSAWVPAGGGPDVPTPTGTLQGVAAFYWDGATWQPSGQAGPDVATPAGVLQGMAMFSPSGTTWAPAVAPGTLDLNFVTMTTLDPSITFTRASVGTYFDGNGVMQTAATNVPRLDHNPVTLASRGLLIEEARTNVITQSADFTTAGYTPNACAITRSGTGAPDGSSLNLITEDTTSAAHCFYGGNITVNAAAWTVSVFIRPGTQRYISLRGETYASSSWPWITFDTQTQTINANAGVTASGFTALPGGTFRIWLTWTALGVGGGNMVVAGCNTAAAPIISSAIGTNYAGTSQTWYAWGLQAEVGAFPTSYIPTGGAALTRAVDVALMNSLPGRNTTTGTLQAECVPNGNAAGTPFIVGGNSGSPVIGIGNDGLLTTAIRAVVGIYSGVGPAITFGAINKVAFAYVSGASTAAVNGTTLAPNAATFATPLAGSVVALGGDAVSPGTLVLNGYMRRFRYWPRALSSAELQQVTT